MTYPPNAATTGNPIWFFQAHPNGEIADLDFGSSPNVITDALGRPILVGAGSKDGVYYAVNAGRTGGALRWSTKVAEVSSGTLGSSVGTVVGGFSGSTGFADQKIFGTTASGPEFQVALNAFSGALAWDAADAVSSFSATGIANGLIYTGDNAGLLKARDASTGMLLFAASVGGSVGASPVPAEGKVIVAVGTTQSNGQKYGVYAFGL
jgi:hypothetical protein